MAEKSNLAPVNVKLKHLPLQRGSLFVYAAAMVDNLPELMKRFTTPCPF